jgi:RNA 3'-terminal phosphate cyclase (ATP)
MLTINGSRMEGGGQIVRTAVALSSITSTPVHIVNIRANRPKPGLAAQHAAAVRAVAEVCSAEVEGDVAGSQELTFHPGDIGKKDIVIDIGTAGSIPLVIQAWLPPALHAGGTITVLGGTEVTRSPTIDYFTQVFSRLIRRFDADIRIEIAKRGYYPRGGGEVTVAVGRSRLQPISIDEQSTDQSCGVCSCSSNLPAHVAERQADAACRELLPVVGKISETIIDRRAGESTGSSCTVWAGARGGIALGRRGYPSESVGKEAARRLIAELTGGGVADRYLSDQLLIYLAEYGGDFTASVFTSHAATVCWLLGEFGYAVKVRERGLVEFEA